MFKIASTLTAFATLASVSLVAIPATAAVQIESALELELPAFMPGVQHGAIFVLDERADWPSMR